MKKTILSLSVLLSLVSAIVSTAHAQQMEPGGCSPMVPTTTGTSSGSAGTGAIALVSGSSFIIQTNGTSLICRVGGC